MIHREVTRPTPKYFPSFQEFTDSLKQYEPNSDEWKAQAEQISGTRIGGWNLWVHEVQDKGYLCSDRKDHATTNLNILVRPPENRRLHKSAKRKDGASNLSSVNGILKFTADGHFELVSYDYVEYNELSFDEFLASHKEAVESKNSEELIKLLRHEFLGTSFRRWRGYCQESKSGDKYIFSMKPERIDHCFIFFNTNEEYKRGVQVEISGTIVAIRKGSIAIEARGYQK